MTAREILEAISTELSKQQEELRTKNEEVIILREEVETLQQQWEFWARKARVTKQNTLRQRVRKILEDAKQPMRTGTILANIREESPTMSKGAVSNILSKNSEFIKTAPAMWGLVGRDKPMIRKQIPKKLEGQKFFATT